MSVTVYFVRHGETYFNRFARLQGWSDTPLTEKGEAEAAAVGRALATVKVDYLFSSDLKRAADTARILIAHHPQQDIQEPTQSPLFREVFYGSFEGHSNEEGAIYASCIPGQRIRRISALICQYGIQQTQEFLHQADPTGLAEGRQQLDRRCQDALAFLRQLPDHSTAVVASHGAFICYLANLIAADGQSYPGPDNGAIMKISLDDQDARIDFYNRKSLAK